MTNTAILAASALLLFAYALEHFGIVRVVFEKENLDLAHAVAPELSRRLSHHPEASRAFQRT